MHSVSLTVLIATRNEEANLLRCLESVKGLAEQIIVLDSESQDGTVDIARRHAAEVRTLTYDHARIIPWILQWGLDNLQIRNEWILILEADQALSVELRSEIAELLARPSLTESGFYIRRRQFFRGREIRHGGYGSKFLLKLFRRGSGRLDPLEQDTRVYVDGSVGRLRAPIDESNRKEEAILFYVEKHLRYADAFAREELARRQGARYQGTPRMLGTPDQRVLWQKACYQRLPLYVRAFAYFLYRYFILLGILDGWHGFVFHFLQAFWFRLVVDLRLAELLSGADAGTQRNAG